MDRSADVVRRAPFGENPLVGERGASTQRRILVAALEVFAERGYHDARVELITEAAGCSRPAFYQYFSSKDDLFWRLAGHLANDMGELAESIDVVSPDEEGISHLRGWLDSFIDLCILYDPILSGYPAAARERRPDAEDLRVIGNRVGVAIVKGAAPDRPELYHPPLTNTMVGLIIRSIYYWQLGLGPLTRTRFVDGLAQTIHRLLHGAIDGVNVGPLTRPPKRRPPKWPEFPGSSDHDPELRPRGQKTREKLLEAGSRVLPERGYHETRVDDIVEAAEVSHGSFYRYFENKDHLFHVLAERAALAMVDLIANFPETAEPEALQRWLHDWFDTYRENGGVISVWQEIDYHDPELPTFSIEAALVTFDRLRRIVSRRGFGDATVDAIVLLSVIEWVPYSVAMQRHIAADDAVEASAFIVRRALFGAEPP